MWLVRGSGVTRGAWETKSGLIPSVTAGAAWGTNLRAIIFLLSSNWKQVWFGPNRANLPRCSFTKLAAAQIISCLTKNIGHFLLAPGLLLRAISNFLSVSPRGSRQEEEEEEEEEEEAEDVASARDHSYLDDGPALPPGWWPGGVMESRGRAEIAFH